MIVGFQSKLLTQQTFVNENFRTAIIYSAIELINVASSFSRRTRPNSLRGVQSFHFKLEM